MEGRRMVKAVLFYKRTRLSTEANKLNFFPRHRLFSICTFSFSEKKRTWDGMDCLPKKVATSMIAQPAIGGSSAATYLLSKSLDFDNK